MIFSEVIAWVLFSTLMNLFEKLSIAGDDGTVDINRQIAIAPQLPMYIPT